MNLYDALAEAASELDGPERLTGTYETKVAVESTDEEGGGLLLIGVLNL